MIGAVAEERQSPEFSDQMEYMVINPSWYVPRTIIAREYLPMLQRNPNAAGHLRITDSSGRVINRNAVNFSAYNARNFPLCDASAAVAVERVGGRQVHVPQPL